MAVLETKISKWGNSQGIRIPKGVMEMLSIHEDQEIVMEVNDTSIILKPVKSKAKNIHELFANWEDDGVRSHEMDWGESKGAELKW